MRTWIAATAKELLLLLRDRAGLLVLFVMPAILVVVITLVQENVLELSGHHQVRLLVHDQDHGTFARTLRAVLAAGQVSVTDYSEDMGADMHRLVADGRYQAGLVIAAGTSRNVHAAMEKLLRDPSGGAQAPASSLASLELIFDPAALAGYRVALVGRLQLAARTAEIELIAGQLEEEFIRRAAANAPLNPVGPPQHTGVAHLREALSQPLSMITEHGAADKGKAIEELFNPVNRNVPAWALFGMFFTAIPLGGGMLSERRSGITLRLSAMPVSFLVLLLGRVSAYLLVCCCQFFLIVLIGISLFPQLGLPAFSLPANPLLLLPVVLASGLAACGLGTLLGTVCRSYEQASALGATTVVSAAALGGVMVPVYAMPQVMQKLSHISPFSWGMDAFLGLLLRGHPLSALYPDLTRLLLFAAAAVILAHIMRPA